MQSVVLTRTAAMRFERAIRGRSWRSFADVKSVMEELLAPVELRMAVDCWMQSGKLVEVEIRGGGKGVKRWGCRCLVVSSSSDMQEATLSALASRYGDAAVVRTGGWTGAVEIVAPEDASPARRGVVPGTLGMSIETAPNGVVAMTLTGRSVLCARSLDVAAPILACGMAGCIHDLRDEAIPRMEVATTRPLFSAFVSAIVADKEGLPAVPAGAVVEVVIADGAHLQASNVLRMALADSAASRQSGPRRLLAVA